MVIIMQYGYIDEMGCLVSREITDDVLYYNNEAGEPQQRAITADEVTALLSADGWKPVMEIDESKAVSNDKSYYIKILPYDAGDRIDFRYERRFDRKKFQTQIDRLKNELAGSDYKVTKCYEASLMGEEPPYDIAALRQERQALRDQINDLESTMQFFLRE
jgi:hypothetical protein